LDLGLQGVALDDCRTFGHLSSSTAAHKKTAIIGGLWLARLPAAVGPAAIGLTVSVWQRSLRERLHPRPPAPSRPRRRPARPAAWYACSVDGDFPRTRRRRLTLGQGQVEHTILVLGLDLRLVGVVGQAEAA